MVFAILIKPTFLPLSEALGEELSPLHALKQFEDKSSSIARRSLQIGLSDAIAALKDVSADTLKKVDNELKSLNLPTLAELMNAQKNIVQKVLTNRRIKTMHQFYVIAELMCDVDSQLTENTRLLLNKYISDFEARGSKK